MKICIFSDLHAHPWKSCSTILPGGGNSRVEDAVRVINTVYDHAEKIQASYVFFTGDLFDRRKSIDVYTFNRIHETITKRAEDFADTVLLPGNHDQANKSGSINALERFDGDHCRVINTPVSFNIGDNINVSAVPYFDDGEVIADHINTLAEASLFGKNILLMHYGVDGAKVNASDYILPCELKLANLRPDKFDLIISGHYHLAQQLGPRFHYVGSAMQHRWGDAGDTKTFIVIDTDTWNIERIPTNAPEFLTVHDKTKNHDVSNKFIRLVRSYELDEARKAKTERSLKNRGALYVEFKFEPEEVEVSSEERIEFAEDADAFEVISDYVNSGVASINGYDKDKLINVGKELVREVGV